MAEISSFNMKQSTYFQVFHNANIRPSYAIGGELECNRKGYEAKELKETIINKAKQAYVQRTKRAFQAKSYEWSAVVNIKPETTMQDLEKLAKHFFDKYGFQCYQIAIHRDEGHIDENGQKQINHHAHLEFITLDKETGKNRQREIKPQTLRQIQDEVAEILAMKRGVDKRISKAKRIEPRKYAQLKEQEKEVIKKINQEHNLKISELVNNLEDEILSKKELKEQFEAFRKEFITLDKETGKNRQREIKPQTLRQIQDEVAEILAMKRGVDKRISKAKRIEPRKYAQLKEQEKEVIKKINQEHNLKISELVNNLEDEILSKKELKEQFEAFRKENANQGLSKEFFRELSQEKKEQISTPSLTQEQLTSYFTELKQKYTTQQTQYFGLKKTNSTDYEKIVKELQNQILDLNDENAALKQINTQTIKTIDQEVKNLLKPKETALNEKYEIKLQELNKEKTQTDKAYKTFLDNIEEYNTKIAELNETKLLKEKNEEIQNLEKETYELKTEISIKNSKINEILTERDKLIQNHSQELLTLKIENSGLKTQNETLIKNNESLKIQNEKQKNTIENFKKLYDKLLNSVKLALKMSFQCVYDRKSKFESKHITFENFMKETPQKQEEICKSNIEAKKDIHNEEKQEKLKKQLQQTKQREFSR